MKSSPSARARTFAADGIALGFVQTGTTVPAIRTPFVLRASDGAGGSAVTGFTFALVGTDASAVETLLGADGHTAAVVGRPREALAAILQHARLLHRLGFEGDFVVDGVA